MEAFRVVSGICFFLFVLVILFFIGYDVVTTNHTPEKTYLHIE